MRTLTVLVFSSLAAPALAQSNVTTSAQSSWSENAGWMNWRDAGTPSGLQGAFADINAGYVTGFVWNENTGWVNLGNGAGPYANTTGLNFGVNIDLCDSFRLSGFAWSENTGWINFSGGAMATPPNTARFDIAESRLKGYAWGENLGWISLDAPADTNGKYVAFSLPGLVCDCVDFNRDGLFPDTSDIADFLIVFAGGPCPNDPNCGDVDFNNDGLFPDTQDILAFLSVFGGGPCI